MKKLLAAVTSIAMSSSLVTSAFATSVTVSAAGGSTAVQPNVSMGEVMDGAVNKIAGQSDDFLASQINDSKKATAVEVNENFIVKGKEYKVKPGEDIEVIFEVETGGHYVTAIIAEMLDLPAGITSELTDDICYADPDTHSWVIINGFSYQITLASKNGSHPAKLLDSDTSDDLNNDIMQLTLHIPEDIAPGEYEYGFDYFEVTEFGQVTADHDISRFNATVIPGKLIVEPLIENYNVSNVNLVVAVCITIKRCASSNCCCRCGSCCLRSRCRCCRCGSCCLRSRCCCLRS